MAEFSEAEHWFSRFSIVFTLWRRQWRFLVFFYFGTP